MSGWWCEAVTCSDKIIWLCVDRLLDIKHFCSTMRWTTGLTLPVSYTVLEGKNVFALAVCTSVLKLIYEWSNQVFYILFLKCSKTERISSFCFAQLTNVSMLFIPKIYWKHQSCPGSKYFGLVYGGNVIRKHNLNWLSSDQSYKTFTTLGS